MKNVPGRRTDWHECQWIQFLHSVGLLRAAFRPDGDVCAVRALMRHRSDLVQMAQPAYSAYAESSDADECADPSRDQRHHGRDRTGHRRCDSWAGNEIRQELAKLRDPHIQASEETIRKSLVGQLAAGAPVHPEAVTTDLPALPGCRSPLAMKRSKSCWSRSSRGWTPKRSRCRRTAREEEARAEEEKRESEDRIRYFGRSPTSCSAWT